jgi:hypothetical protein
MIRNNVVIENVAGYGGGIYGCDGIIENNIISGNSTRGAYAGAGAGLYACDGTIQNNIITQNRANEGSDGNSWAGCGGGLAVCNGTIQTNTIRNNSANVGGGLYVCGGTVQNNVISENSVEKTRDGAHGWGGGLHQCMGTIRNNLICGNLADGWGGGLYYCSDAIIRNNTICDNSGSYGGGVSRGGTIQNCILWGNMCTREGAQVYQASPTYSCIEGWTGGGPGNISANPVFADPGNGDYHLRSEAGRWDPNNEIWVQDDVTSPCIDGGDPNSDWTGELWPHGKRVNMGAYGGTTQASMSQSSEGNAADCNYDDAVNGTDIEMIAQRWLHQGFLLVEDINRDGVINFPDFALLGQSWLWER